MYGVPRITRLGAGDWIRLMLFSYPGWGKTSLAATTAEAGYKTLIIRSPMDQVPARALKAGAEQCEVNVWEDMTGGDGIQDYLRMADHGFEWVWLDCLSIIQDVLLDDVWAGTIAERPGRAFKLDRSGKIIGPNLSPSSGLDRGEYGRNMERIQQFVRHIVGCKRFHVGITCHPYEGQHPTNDQGGSLLVPYIQGKNMTEKICGYCNIVAFLELMEEDDDTQLRRLHVRENPRFYAKDLYDAFPKGYIDNPTMKDIIDAVEAAKGKRPAATPTRGRKKASTGPTAPATKRGAKRGARKAA